MNLILNFNAHDYRIQNNYNKFAIEMHLKYAENTLYPSTKMLQKSTSMPTFMETTDSSSNSIDTQEEEYRKSAIKWILSINKRVSKDTHYLAIAYLNKFVMAGAALTEENHEKIAIAVLLIASKMNEIYPPKISTLIARCKHCYSRQQVITMEGMILAAFGFDIGLEHTPYTYLSYIMMCSHAQKLEECEKLLRIVAPHREVYQHGDQILAYAIIYLILPNFVRQMRLKDNQKIKTLAVKIYNIYMTTKERFEKDKENRKQ